MNNTTTKKHTGYCLLHGDFHPMDSDCWHATTEFYFRWTAPEDASQPTLTAKEVKDKYDTEVERKMMYDLSIEIASGMWG